MIGTDALLIGSGAGAAAGMHARKMEQQDGYRVRILFFGRGGTLVERRTVRGE